MYNCVYVCGVNDRVGVGSCAGAVGSVKFKFGRGCVYGGVVSSKLKPPATE